MVCAVLALTCWVAGVPGDVPDSGSEDSAKEAAAIRERADAYVAAYNRRDAAALASLWSENAVYVNRDTGERIQGRDAIAAMFRELFQAGGETGLRVSIEAIRLITPEVAIEDGRAEFTSAEGNAMASTYTAVHVKQAGTWYLDSVRETEMPAPSSAPSGRLEDLGWLVGEWLDQDDSTTVRTTWEWAKNKHFLVSHFRVGVADHVELEGTQIIGWDPVAGSIRSWVFDSEGGFGEGAWRQTGNQWTVESTSTMSDGSQGSATSVYTLLDANRFTWKSVERRINGEMQPDIDEVIIQRQ
ncbi:MAG: SgcJ/EcaC family oxidoreductase [Pirellulaceae bacterium]